MNRWTFVAERLNRVFAPSSEGVVRLVDNLLDLCREQSLQIDWKNGRCYVCPLGATLGDSLAIPCEKSIFRAALARVATLCNERVANSVTPYRGEGELIIAAPLSAVFRVTFINTPSEQHLEVTCLTDHGRDLRESLESSHEPELANRN